MTLGEATLRLSKAGISSAREEAKLLFCRFGSFTQAMLIGTDPECESEELLLAVRRRESREPLQYIIGEVAFYNEVYYVTPDCLIPRSDTEHLVEYAVANIPEGEIFADLCTGSGCVGISTLCNTRGTRCLASDISSEALDVAEKNAERNGVLDRFSVRSADLLTSDPLGDEEYFAILSNPPYIPRLVYEGLEPEIFREPRGAFVGGENGSVFYRRLIPLSLGHLKKGGFIALEIGYDQGELLTLLAGENSCTIEIIKDYGGHDRVAVLRLMK